MSPARLLLLSNSTNPGQGYLTHAIPWLADALETSSGSLAFIPFAGVTLDWDEYTARVAAVVQPLGWAVEGLHRAGNAVEALRRADAVAVGGGNTFQLLRTLRDRALLEPLRRLVAAGRPYLGWSAGSNVACPTIGTTNDMPIVDPHGHDALGLVPFQLNAHYTEATLPRHGGESRRQRLTEFLAANPRVSVIGLPEGTALRRQGERLVLLGPEPAMLYRPGSGPEPTTVGADLSFLLTG